MFFLRVDKEIFSEDFFKNCLPNIPAPCLSPADNFVARWYEVSSASLVDLLVATMSLEEAAGLSMPQVNKLASEHVESI